MEGKEREEKEMEINIKIGRGEKKGEREKSEGKEIEGESRGYRIWRKRWREIKRIEKKKRGREINGVERQCFHKAPSTPKIRKASIPSRVSDDQTRSMQHSFEQERRYLFANELAQPLKLPQTWNGSASVRDMEVRQLEFCRGTLLPIGIDVLVRCHAEEASRHSARTEAVYDE
ncbi:hypothetical protein TNCV_3507551 [Trichonephila clavipes]|uniref:Uncharacterized protein n=1 Tax=Trichonephila clavipes TaxID=2585209 RepID=A0A8X6S1Q8_TRICX|nr:hypothetical protein TNCV_3507551 [Trichonephila clavipes]